MSNCSSSAYPGGECADVWCLNGCPLGFIYASYTIPEKIRNCQEGRGLLEAQTKQTHGFVGGAEKTNPCLLKPSNFRELRIYVEETYACITRSPQTVGGLSRPYVLPRSLFLETRVHAESLVQTPLSPPPPSRPPAWQQRGTTPFPETGG